MKSEIRNPKSEIRRRAPRRGVLLLVVLSLLVLFMLIGTAFLMTSSQYQQANKTAAKVDRVDNFPTKRLDRAVLQVICDTGNPNSAIRYHSLLRDLYGSEGFEAMVYSPIDDDVRVPFPAGNPDCQVTRYATPTNGAPPNATRPYGPTQGQLIDIYVREHAFQRDDRLIYGNEPLPAVPDARNIIKLEPSVLGLPEMYNMPLTKGYFNGCTLTITSGPARGQSTRIVDYDYIGEFTNQPGGIPPSPNPIPSKPKTQLFRFRVLAFPNAAGEVMLPRRELPITDSRRSTNAARGLEIADLVAAEQRDNGGKIVGTTGATFVVNGRPFNGTGTGFNELAKAGEPRLNAVQTVGIVSDDTKWLYPEIALTPNSKYFFAADPLKSATNSNVDLWGARYANPATGKYDPLNPINTNTVPFGNRPALWKYQSFVGPGDADESYDAADFQNMALALQTVTPRARGRVVQGANPQTPATLEVDDPAVNSSLFLRLDLEDLPIPSFHRPDLENFWFHRLLNAPFLVDAISDPSDRVRAILHPFDDTGAPQGGLTAQEAGQILAIKRMISLRPLREDNPNFDGSNPASRNDGLPSDLVRGDNPNQIAVPFWEAVGPWDVDNDNDGVPDSNWVDLGDPVQQAEDGTLYKPLYAFLVVDLDSRLNVNAHGLVDDLRSPKLDAMINPVTNIGPGNLAHDLSDSTALNSSDYLPSGSGYGPAEISLRPLLSPDLPGNSDSILRARIGNPAYDDYARILNGRPAYGNAPSVWGRYGSVNVRGNVVAWANDSLAVTEADKVRPGVPYYGAVVPGQADPVLVDRLASFKFFGYPVWTSDFHGDLLLTPLVKVPSAFSNPPDLMGRYAIGLDYSGQPNDESAADTYYYGNHSLIVDTPYDLNLSDPSRRDTPDPSVEVTIASAKTTAINDDAPFATADLERILRAHDADSGILPDRLWSVVDAFDPLKLVDNQPAYVVAAAQQIFNLGSGNPDNVQALAAAQEIAEVNRRLVTTDSYDLSVPSSNFLKRLIYGADGQPGVAGFDDDGDGKTDDPKELGWSNSDDWYAVMNRVTPPPATPTAPPVGVRLEPENPTIVDLLKYRVQYERGKRGLANYTDAQLTLVTQQLLAPEILAGGKMDLNRPFGDGRDNAGNGKDDNGDGQIDEPGEPGDLFNLGDGIVDDPLEAGEPFIDSNASPNGIRDSREWFYNVIGGSGELTNDDSKYDGPRDRLWQGLTSEPIGFSYNHGGVVTDGRLTDANGDLDPNDPEDGRLRYNGIIQRQTYARHLYCLMMLLVDENYVATQNVSENAEGNINLQFMYQQLVLQIADERGHTGFPTQADIDDAKALALKKLTARRIAQWAVNCVDFRDADSIMTPFEYDENPFDGWGTYGPNDNFIPIDGDPSTNENWGSDFPYPKKYDPKKPIDSDPKSPNYNVKNDTNAINSTRAVVWGVERPELLITETLAFHDRRCTDEAFADNSTIVPTGNPPDYDLDQRLKPRGALYVELYNPWSVVGEHCAELYGRDAASANPSQGVMLNRLSSFGVSTANGQKRSPIWRVAVVQDPINGRLSNQIVDISALSAPGGAQDRDAIASQFLTTDVDGFGFDSDRDAERLVYFTTGRDYTTGAGSDPDRQDDNIFTTEYTNIPNKIANPDNPNLRVWVPPLPYRERQGRPEVRTAKRYFIARTERAQGAIPNDADVPIAPILPGRYAVIGPSGLQLDLNGHPIPDSVGVPRAAQIGDRYVLPISRLQVAGAGLQSDQQDADHVHPTAMRMTRRIELWPSIDPDSPVMPNANRPAQLLVAENGGPEIVSNQSGSLVNATDSDHDGIPDAAIVEPCVAIPVEDLNISEPVEAYQSPQFGYRDGYPTERYIEMYQSPSMNPAGQGLPLNVHDAQLNAYGELEYTPPYDRPLDTEPELIRNGTTQNYRSVHLQRLANPLFPWNPPKYDEDGKEDSMHRPELPVNPYLTIDSQSVDLTAYNGASQLERSDLPVAAPLGTPTAGGSGTPSDDLLQGDYFAPLSAGEYLQAPDHVLAGLLTQLIKEGIVTSPWVTVEKYRGTGSLLDEQRISSDLDALEQKREGDTVDRGKLKTLTEWRWHQLRRVLPDDTAVAPQGTYKEEQFKQRFNLKSMERGAHYLQYYKWPQAGSPEGWWFDTRWTPRLIWKQERPNAMLFLRGAGGTVRVTDMKNVSSRRMLTERLTDIPPPRPEDHFTQDDDRRNAYLASNYQLPHHVIDFALEQTLGFVNESYAPDLDRPGNQDKSAMLQAGGGPMPGAPEIATAPNSLSQPEANELNRWNTVPTPQKVLIQPAEELQRRQQLMKSTFPWLAWNNRPFVGDDELTQVPASSTSLMLREYSVANRYTANPYDGNGVVDPIPSPGQPDPETNADRLARQQGAFGHLLNFFLASERPAGTYATTTAPLEPLSGGPNYYRLLDFVEVPSRYVGTETMFSPEVFNDNPLDTSVADNILDASDPRYALQPPFNKVSRERDPGKVNLNTVTGRRRVESNGFVRHWSEVFDGIMHRYGDGNLMDPTVVAPNPPSALQLSHFGPAWRDVELSRRGYAQYNADGGAGPVEKLVDTQFQPETFAFGLNPNFPTMFSNPFRSADAGDLVPLPNMVRPGVDATWLRGHHWQRADDDVLIANPYAAQGSKYGPIAWGRADYDDDGNGIKDDIREAGFGVIDPTIPPNLSVSPYDGDTLRIKPSLNNALESSGIPLFAESLPEPAIDAERNPGMMYQPMMRLGNLVTTRSNVYAIWVTVGYFEVEKAPDWSDNAVQQRFGGDGSANSDATVRARALYDRVYPEGYMLGEELGTDTGATQRQRAFYIIDRTEPVGFKPGEDLNADKLIRVRRRIE